MSILILKFLRKFYTSSNPQEQHADIFALTFMVNNIHELIDIVQSNVEVVGLEEA